MRFTPFFLVVVLCIASVPAFLGTVFASQIIQPAASPSNADIVAYSRYQDNSEHLYLYHVVSGKEVRLTPNLRGEDSRAAAYRQISRAFSADSRRVESFEGDLAWRPVLDPYGLQWFAFVAPRNGRMTLFLGFITSEQNLDYVLFPVRSGSIASSPAFSPDGSKLAFVSDGEIHLIDNLRSVIFRRDTGIIEPVRLTSSRNRSFFPAWSFDSRLIAYQRVSDERGHEQMESIYVVDGSRPRKGVIPASHILSVRDDIENLESNHYRPSWSSNRLVLSYFESAGPGHERTDMSEKKVRMVRVLFDENQNRYYSSLFDGANDRYVARSACAPLRGRPRWFNVDIGRQSLDGIIWAQRCMEEQNPIFLSDFNRYVRGQNNYSINLFAGGEAAMLSRPTMSNRHPSVINARDHMRFLYVSKSGYSDNLEVFDVDVTPRFAGLPLELNTGTALMRAGAFPGSGHRYIGKHKRGTFWSTAFATAAGVTAAATVYRYINTSPAPSNEILFGLGAATAGVWMFNLVDMARFLPAKTTVPIASTYRGYLLREELTGDQGSAAGSFRGIGRGSDTDPFTRYGPGRTNAVLLAAIYPGLGHLYLGKTRRGVIYSSLFTAALGTTALSAAYRWNNSSPEPGNDILLGMGAATAGIWLTNLIGVTRHLPDYRDGTFISSSGEYRSTGKGDKLQGSMVSRYGQGRKNTLFLAALYPGLGHRYLGETNRGKWISGVFSAFLGTTASATIYRWINTSPEPADEILLGLGAATFGIWAFNMIDAYRLMPKWEITVFSEQSGFHGHDNTGGYAYRDGYSHPTSAHDDQTRVRISMGPSVGQVLNKQYMSMGVSVSF